MATGRRINGLDGLMDAYPLHSPAGRAADSGQPVPRCSSCQREPELPSELRSNPQQQCESPATEPPCFHCAASPAHPPPSDRPRFTPSFRITCVPSVSSTVTGLPRPRRADVFAPPPLPAPAPAAPAARLPPRLLPCAPLSLPLVCRFAGGSPGCTRNTKFPCVPLCNAAAGITIAFARSSRISRTFTNWFGNNAPSLLSKTAFTFTVPVVVSIWLSTVSTFPLARCVVSDRS